MSDSPELQIIRSCIDRCAAARDWRGRWRVVIDTTDALRFCDPPRSLYDVGLARSTAEAAARFGAWLRERTGA